MHRFWRVWLSGLLVGAAGMALPGCQTIDIGAAPVATPAAFELEPPREKSMVSLPAYQIAPPDVLQVEVLKLVPLSPYRTEVFDALQIRVLGALPDQPIDGTFLIAEDGTITLGPSYGKLAVAGMTLEEIRHAAEAHLENILTEPEVSVALARMSSIQEVTGQYLVGPDGTINLRKYGQVYLAGKTVAEANAAIEAQLSRYFDSPRVSVEVRQYNSTVYYVVTEGAGLGDSVVRVPVTGKETVLDALVKVGGLSQVSGTKIWIARPAPGHVGCDQILPVDYHAITRGASTATNYQLLPGDRVFISEDDTAAVAILVNKVLDPFERIAGAVSLGTAAVRSTQTLGRGYNLLRGPAYFW